MIDAIEAVTEIFTWVGLGAGVLLAGAALIALLADGTWVPVRAVVEHLGDATVVRWFDGDGEVNEAPLSEAQMHELDGQDMADVYARVGRSDTMRLTRRSPLVVGMARLAGVLVGVGAAAAVASLVLLFVQG